VLLPIQDEAPVPTSALLGPIESDSEDEAEDFEPVADVPDVEIEEEISSDEDDDVEPPAKKQKIEVNEE